MGWLGLVKLLWSSFLAGKGGQKRVLQEWGFKLFLIKSVWKVWFNAEKMQII